MNAMDKPLEGDAKSPRSKDEAQRQAAQDDLERKLIAGLESGTPIEVTSKYWEERRRKLMERHGTQ